MANRLARLVSVLFDSSVLSLPIFFALGWSGAGAAGLGWATLTLLVMTGIPLAYLVIGKRQGWVSDFEMSQRVERPRFILVSLSSDVLALLRLTMLGAPHTLRVMALTYLCLGVTMFTISNYWKISLHMVGVSGFSTALVFVFGAPALVAFLSLPLVAWARWTLIEDKVNTGNKNNLIEIVAVESPETLTPEQIRTIILAGPGMVLRNHDLPQKIIAWDIPIYMELLYNAKKNFNPGQPNSGPFLDAVPTPSSSPTPTP